MGPLQGIKVVEFAGLGPVPFSGMVLSDLGAEVVQINREANAPESNLFAPEKNIPEPGTAHRPARHENSRRHGEKRRYA
jgi:crotonobetainyl-CoA:carnitine CoA-transferase CaiB-like acyl-CoA transferase